MNGIENIDELISKFLSGEASPEEAMLLEDWKNKSQSNLTYFERSETLFSAPVAVDAAGAWKRIEPQLIAGKRAGPVVRPLFYYRRIAASVALLIGLAAFIMYLADHNKIQKTAYVTGAESEQVKLSDGTDVSIAPNSTLTADKEFGRKDRVLHLRGSATFAVVHNAAIPFIVDAGGIFIKDIGTKFNIRTFPDTDTVHVHVDEGVVLLFDSLGAEIEIKAGGNALYIRSRKQIVGPEKEVHKAAQFNFAKNTLEDVVKHLNEAYQVNISIEKETVKKCTITTQFRNEKLETVLSVITETLGLTYEKTDKGFIIKGDQCVQ